MIWLYNLLWFLAFPGVICYLTLRRLLSGKYRQNLSSRLGFNLRDLEKPVSEKVIWVHALSVGEVLSAVPLVNSITEQLPEHKVVITTTTEAGQLIAHQKLASLHCRFAYLPLDFWWLVRRMVQTIGASLFVIVETDLWPNLLWCLAKASTPIVLVNGRLSDRSFSRYQQLRKFFSRAFNHIDVFCMQSQEDARRLRLLGIEPAKIQVTGNLKFDQILEKTVSREREELTRELAWTPPPFTWIAGSTHAGEEDIILKVYSKLRRQFSELCLVLAPRSQERFPEVFRLAEQAGWQTARRSQPLARKDPGSPVDVLILDTIGELARFYSLGNFAFVGGSLVPFGGHNPLEAAQRGLPVVFGPHMENFKEIAQILTESGCGFQVADELQLLEQVRAWLAAPATCRQQGEKAQAALLAHQGAVARNLEVIQRLLGTGKAGQ